MGLYAKGDRVMVAGRTWTVEAPPKKGESDYRLSTTADEAEIVGLVGDRREFHTLAMPPGPGLDAVLADMVEDGWQIDTTTGTTVYVPAGARLAEPARVVHTLLVVLSRWVVEPPVRERVKDEGAADKPDEAADKPDEADGGPDVHPVQEPLIAEPLIAETDVPEPGRVASVTYAHTQPMVILGLPDGCDPARPMEQVRDVFNDSPIPPYARTNFAAFYTGYCEHDLNTEQSAGLMAAWRTWNVARELDDWDINEWSRETTATA